MSKITIILSAILLFAFIAACDTEKTQPPQSTGPTITLIDSQGPAPADVAIIVSGAKPNDYVDISINGNNRMNPAGKWADANGIAKWELTERIRIFGCEGDQTVVTAIVGGVAISATHTITAPPCPTPVVSIPTALPRTPADSIVVPAVTPVTPAVTPVTPDEPTVTPAGPTVTPAGPTVTPAGPTVTPDEPTVSPAGPTVTPVPTIVIPEIKSTTPRFESSQSFILFDSPDSDTGVMIYRIYVSEESGKVLSDLGAMVEI